MKSETVSPKLLRKTVKKQGREPRPPAELFLRSTPVYISRQ